MRRAIVCLLVSAGLLVFRHDRAQASEGAFSYYFPGIGGSFAVAVAPDPGPLLVNQTLFLGGSVNRAVLQGRSNAALDLFAVYDLLGGLYTFEKPLLGGRFSMGGFLPIGHVSLDATLSTPLRTRSISASDTNIGDLVLMPGALHWNVGNFHFKLYELIFAPTGHYDVDQNVNVGRNYWGFDTNLAVTWFNKQTGTEISLAPGIMINTKNEATDYRTGTEFHLDFMVNQFLSPHFALGFQGYYYKQISGDSGSGATLGDFKGESVGIGPAVLWIPQWAGGRLILSGKWLHDLDAKNRLKADYGLLTVAVKF